VKKDAAPARSKTSKESKPVPAEQPVVQADPPKKGWLKGLFSKSKTKIDTETPAEPQLAKAKTAKPAPVKEVKPPAQPVPLVVADEPARKERRGRKNRAPGRLAESQSGDR
jgi:hypothetical protein